MTVTGGPGDTAPGDGYTGACRELPSIWLGVGIPLGQARTISTPSAAILLVTGTENSEGGDRSGYPGH